MSIESVNSACPFSGKAVQADSIAEVQGKKIGFCNPGCRDKFQNNPQDYPQVLAEFLPDGRFNHYDGAGFLSVKEWGNRHIANLNGVSVKIHSTSTPYQWHVNTGQEVFVVLDGKVEMRYQRGKDNTCKSVILTAGMIAHMEPGCEHVAYPVGLARVLVIENLGSV